MEQQSNPLNLLVAIVIKGTKINAILL